MAEQSAVAAAGVQVAAPAPVVAVRRMCTLARREVACAGWAVWSPTAGDGGKMSWQDEQKKIATGVTGKQEPKRERNFCERCGKRLFDGIHTCTPPAEQLKRKWVGLRWSDTPDKWVGNVAFMEGAKWAERTLKERNA